MFAKNQENFYYSNSWKNVRKCFIIFVTVLLVVEVSGSDEQFINNVLDEVTGHGDYSKEHYFISKMWPKISEIIPLSVKIPNFQKIIVTNDWPLQTLRLQHSTYRVPFFLCTMETSIELEVGDIVNINFEKRDDITNCNVEAKLHFKNPVNFKIYVKDSDEHASEPVPVSYLFEGQNTVKFWLKIPNFSKEREKITPECVISIDSFSVEKLSKPTIDEGRFKDNEARKMEKLFWDIVKLLDIHKMISMAIMKALTSKLQADISPKTSEDIQKTTKTSWVCLNNLVEHSEDDKKASNPNHEIDENASKSDQRESKKKRNHSQLMESVQLGIEQSISSLSSQPQRYVFMMDFTVAEHKSFTSNTPGMTNDKPKFTFTTYAPVAFRHLRDFFGMKEETFMATFCRVPLIELRNPGNSGSLLYLSENKYFIAKSVQSNEVDLLIRLLPAFVLYLYQNPATLLPKFYGLFRYKQSIINSLHLLVMNNVMPPNLHINKKYDLKGSTTDRKLTEDELLKNNYPTYKDIDFENHHPQGMYLRANDYKQLMKTIQSDTLMLQSFRIMDYSLLLGVHYEDQAKEKSGDSSKDGKHILCEPQDDATARNMFKSGIPAWTGHGEKLTVFLGILDVLQSYRLIKKTENFFKSFIYGDKFSVQEPAFYANRFENFLVKRVFKMLPPCPAS